jgi:hypothetical protein
MVIVTVIKKWCSTLTVSYPKITNRKKRKKYSTMTVDENADLSFHVFQDYTI